MDADSGLVIAPESKVQNEVESGQTHAIKCGGEEVTKNDNEGTDKLVKLESEGKTADKMKEQGMEEKITADVQAANMIEPEDKETDEKESGEGLEDKKPNSPSNRKLPENPSEGSEVEDPKTENSKTEDSKTEDPKAEDPKTEDVNPSHSNPSRPIKRARTGYFIFADERRPAILAKYPGQAMPVIARELGQAWGSLTEKEKGVYKEEAAREKERFAQEIAENGGIDTAAPQKVVDPIGLILPTSRIRKICKLDSDVQNLSKEATMLITKCAELAVAYLGQEAVKVAQIQNRRTLMPEDVAQVCTTREKFLFLREDIKDLVREQKETNQSNKTSRESASMTAAAANSKPLTSFFAPKT